jgi:large subunit ribosomal protein L25
MAEMTLNVQSRAEFGKSASKRIRRDGMVPAIVYGGSEDNVPVKVDPKEIYGVLRSEAGRNTILSLEVEGGGSSVILKDWQVDPVTETILHADFQRIAMDKVLRVTVPIAIRGEAIGVKAGEGLLDLVLREVDVECLPGDIPERIECDVSELRLHDNIRIGDLPFPDNVEILAEADRVVAHVVALRAEEEEAAEAEEGEVLPVEGADEGEPEVLTKGKKEEEGGE